MEYLSLILSFIVGGGITALANWRIAKKTTKVDFADKAIQFMEKQNDGLMKRVTRLEDEVKNILKLKCERVMCPDRIQQS